MTKKAIIKWLEGQKTKALIEVEHKAAQERAELLAWKLKASNFDKLVAEIEPTLNSVYETLQDWHKRNVGVCGETACYYGSLFTALTTHLQTRDTFSQHLATCEFHETAHDAELKKKFARLRKDVEKTYADVFANLAMLSNAKLCAEYLEGLGFDLSELKAEKPVETALAAPIDTRFLMITQKEESNE